MTNLTRNDFPGDCNMFRSRICFLEGLPTIKSIVEGFGGVPSCDCTTLNPSTIDVGLMVDSPSKNKRLHDPGCPPLGISY